MGHYIAYLVLWTTFTNLSLGAIFTEREMQHMAGKFCGDHLADMLSLVCGGLYNHKGKRTMFSNKIENNDDYDDTDSLGYFDDSLMAFPFRSKERAKSLINFQYQKRKGDKKGVVDECCHKSCSLLEMRGYCAN
ncbi:hypothetical protein PPYR_11005 [Photinus pyralis]|uniref:Insulin-like domain-containing protein n=2 Tax=Photinus pyralis TaxID=7054 RepID=A0A5N4AI06_PHOPY|nr:hypothetical protein PPYR_11002 [Photinus pyralis]KAB0796944.1 hypothetical protein PPYR_11005 [Photinus pyralis]